MQPNDLVPRSLPRAVLPRLPAGVLGAGALVAVGYMDPGNWATAIAGGAGFGYALLFVVLASSLVAMAVQALAVRVTIATGKDLAALLNEALPRPAARAVWWAAEAAILATAVAELAGGAIALDLLSALPLPAGVAATAAATFAVVALVRDGAVVHERVVNALLAVVALSFAALLWRAGPDWSAAAAGLVPAPRLVGDPQALFIALGILGATVMPHNIYLHSGLVADRMRGLASDDRRRAFRVLVGDAVAALSLAMLVNAAILLVAAASLGSADGAVASLDGAHRAINAALGGAAALIFAVALYAAGQSSAITGILAGRYITAGFTGQVGSRLKRGLFTRLGGLTIALGLLVATGGDAPDRVLVLSQVTLSAALPFVLVPLLVVAMRRRLMGGFTLRPLAAGALASAIGTIVLLNVYLLAMAPMA
ncbi:MAG: Nramp family divalent metal transporter [Alphaproteobacteria bacterium]|nr:Nramp family divalent metal transporter [Alphaproteobacteria bacterium]